MDTICAWCMVEQGETAQEGDSHGICQDHAEAMMIDYEWTKLQQVPSYVEQQAATFASEQESE